MHDYQQGSLRRGGVAFIDASIGPVSASITRNFGGKETATIETCSIDGLFLTRLDFMKLDIEGAELKALQGARNTLEEFRPVVCVEAGNEADYTPVAEFLESLGYTAFVFDEAGSITPMPEPFEFQFNVFFIPESRQ